MGDSYLDFIERVYRKIGLDLSKYKRPQMERRITSLMRSCGVDNLVDYFKLLDTNKPQLDRFINHLTINVSEFYRNPGQWQVLQDKILPQLLKNNPNLKIWSAGCSSGEEPYTLAMVANQVAPKGNHQILATDIDEEVLKKAQNGFYNIKSAVNLPKHFLTQHFDQEGELLKVKDSLKRMIKFKKLNLLEDVFESNIDLLVCRNVVIYFTEEAKAVLYKKFHKSLRSGGILFIGSTEQIFQPQDIGFKSSAMFFYEKF